jgi:hypothetical protein
MWLHRNSGTVPGSVASFCTRVSWHCRLLSYLLRGVEQGRALAPLHPAWRSGSLPLRAACKGPHNDAAPLDSVVYRKTALLSARICFTLVHDQAFNCSKPGNLYGPAEGVQYNTLKQAKRISFKLDFKKLMSLKPTLIKEAR